VQNGVTGLHVDALDPVQVADRIEQLLDHPEQVRRMGTAAHARVAQDMTWDRFVDRYEALLQGTMAGQSANG
jgi:glycosyltransferase involved in cell wall biosynthesis